MIVSSLAEDGAEQTVAALALGAADTLPKPGTGRFNGRFSEILLAKLRRSATRRCRAIAGSQRQPRDPRLRAMPADPIAALGDRRIDRRHPRARSVCSPGFPREIGVPILITQHLPAPFMPVFARQLAPSRGARRWSAKTACAFCPTGSSSRRATRISRSSRTARQSSCGCPDAPASSGCLPSVDPMLASVGAVYGAPRSAWC